MGTRRPEGPLIQLIPQKGITKARIQQTLEASTSKAEIQRIPDYRLTPRRYLCADLSTRLMRARRVKGVQFQEPKTSICKAGIQKEPEYSTSKEDLDCPLIQLIPKKSLSKARVQKMLEASTSKAGIQKKPEATVSKAGIQREPESSSITKAGVFCDCCLKYGHNYYKCPYRLSVEGDVKLGARWVIVCLCCRETNAHPGRKRVRKRAITLFCGRCLSHDHLPEDCDLPPIPGTAGARSDARRVMRRKKMHG